ncbi:type II toxin-antitoxin system HicB family antitoxin [Paraburkholderia saeva]|uniref:Antitoxin HicB n=1 Tax=Paraburkholderia saeva TaxID=2777537 RepID=A0A9N8RTL1_9BURK|nr:type II toxin-antitoxin system HicB family antitoxin [Paraburkholderia saeva]CAG4888742.1 Antitoxin HicB [Paraburkholderia saeva]CAG4912424.1 Antitoxin HicB [Paraburkholderia saeva]
MFRYPARIERDEAGFTVSFRDIPEALTSGATLDEAREMAVDALATAMDFYFEDKRPVPSPSKPRRGEALIELPASLAAKVLLLNEMLRQKVSPAELARRLHTRPQEIQRVIDIGHVTKIDTIASAFAALGKRLELSVVPA